jgi:hypothetical protein
MEKRHPNFKDITGMKFGKLTAIRFVFSKKTGKSGKNAYWECKCDCGNVHIGTGYNLRSGQLISCGCAYQDMGQRMVKPNNTSPKNNLYNLYIQRCKGRREFSLSKEQLFALVVNPCYYCGIDFSINKKTKYGQFKCNGLDRINNLNGYTMDNVLPCCHYCNAIRMDVLTVEETKAVVNHIKIIRGISISPWIQNRDVFLNTFKPYKSQS